MPPNLHLAIKKTSSMILWLGVSSGGTISWFVVADPMYLRSLRIGAILLTLAQLCVWGVYAPAHRLLHHSHVPSTQPAKTAPHSSKCCSHHQHRHDQAPQPSSECPTSTPNFPDQCPDDDNQCGLCQLAIQAGHAADAVELTHAPMRIVPLSEEAGDVASLNVIRPFDSRGPPIV